MVVAHVNGVTHIIGGAAALAAADRLGVIDASATNYALAVFGSMFPDLDAGRAMITRPSRWLPFGLGKKISSHVVDGVAGMAGRATRRVLGHRGALHWPLSYAGAMGIWWILMQRGYGNADVARYGLPVLIGIGSHLFLDFLTRRSIPLFAPFSKKIIALPARVKTGGWAENVIAGLLSAGVAALWWK